jgi:hypothetical protein
MARRPDPAEFDRPLSRREVGDLRKHLSSVDPFRVIRVYQDAHEACRLHGEMIPKASAVQTLVTAWKVLRKRRNNRPSRPD